jgi:hypothetical protein
LELLNEVVLLHRKCLVWVLDKRSPPVSELKIESANDTVRRSLGADRIIAEVHANLREDRDLPESSDNLSWLKTEIELFAVTCTSRQPEQSGAASALECRETNSG